MLVGKTYPGDDFIDLYVSIIGIATKGREDVFVSASACCACRCYRRYVAAQTYFCRFWGRQSPRFTDRRLGRYVSGEPSERIECRHPAEALYSTHSASSQEQP